jgi:hypothetical protein
MSKPITTPFGPIHESVPLDPALGYPAGTAVRIRVNPTKAQWKAWLDGSTPAPNETDAQKADREAALLSALHALYQACVLPGFDFSTPDATRATWDNPDVPDEFWIFLLQLPWQIIATRREAILKNAMRSSPPPPSITTSTTTTE